MLSQLEGKTSFDVLPWVADTAQSYLGLTDPTLLKVKTAEWSLEIDRSIMGLKI